MHWTVKLEVFTCIIIKYIFSSSTLLFLFALKTDFGRKNVILRSPALRIWREKLTNGLRYSCCREHNWRWHLVLRLNPPPSCAEPTLLKRYCQWTCIIGILRWVHLCKMQDASEGWLWLEETPLAWQKPS